MSRTAVLDERPVSDFIDPDLFWDKVDVGHPLGCWQWTGASDSRGYGYFGCHTLKTTLKPHRVAYLLLMGSIPAGYELDHLCLNKGCVNPDHLEPVTSRTNMLRGHTVARRNAAKTHCPRGHRYSPENTWVDKTGSRHCRPCMRARNRGEL